MKVPDLDDLRPTPVWTGHALVPQASEPWLVTPNFTIDTWALGAMTTARDSFAHTLVARTQFAVTSLCHFVEVKQSVLGGLPVIRGTRYPVAQILAEVADGATVDELADEFDVSAAHVRGFLRGLSALMNRPMSR